MPIVRCLECNKITGGSHYCDCELGIVKPTSRSAGAIPQPPVGCIRCGKTTGGPHYCDCELGKRRR
jgi:hypothetical protein